MPGLNLELHSGTAVINSDPCQVSESAVARGGTGFPCATGRRRAQSFSAEVEWRWPNDP